jgi:hypothetical protein
MDYFFIHQSLLKTMSTIHQTISLRDLKSELDSPANVLV